MEKCNFVFYKKFIVECLIRSTPKKIPNPYLACPPPHHTTGSGTSVHGYVTTIGDYIRYINLVDKYKIKV